MCVCVQFELDPPAQRAQKRGKKTGARVHHTCTHLCLHACRIRVLIAVNESREGGGVAVNVQERQHFSAHLCVLHVKYDRQVHACKCLVGKRREKGRGEERRGDGAGFRKLTRIHRGIRMHRHTIVHIHTSASRLRTAAMVGCFCCVALSQHLSGPRKGRERGGEGVVSKADVKNEGGNQNKGTRVQNKHIKQAYLFKSKPSVLHLYVP